MERRSEIHGLVGEEDSILSDDFDYLADPTVSAGALRYSELASKYPRIRTLLDSISLPIILVRTGDTELIEDMFSRLNEAVPLNAPEKRNAFGGPLPKSIRRLAKHPFFKRLPFSNRRCRHYDLCVKFLYSAFKNEIVDTKKTHLDSFVRDFRGKSPSSATRLEVSVRSILDEEAGLFRQSDPLLKTVGMVALYFHLFRVAESEGWVGKLKRTQLQRFEKQRLENRIKAENESEQVDCSLIEFDRLTQSPNDGVAMAFRFKVLKKFLRSELKLPEEGAATVGSDVTKKKKKKKRAKKRS